MAKNSLIAFYDLPEVAKTLCMAHWERRGYMVNGKSISKGLDEILVGRYKINVWLVFGDDKQNIALTLEEQGVFKEAMFPLTFGEEE